jgi:hypothetical protein
MSLGRAVKFLGTATAASALAGFTGYATYTWAHMFMPFKTACLAGIGVGLIPGLVFNKMLTNAYRKHERWANEVGSLFGMLMAVNLVALPAIYLGIGGPAGTLAVEEAARQAAVQFELVEAETEVTLDTFPASEVGTGYVWVHNVGTVERPRVIGRLDNGRLRAQYLPPRGSSYEDAARPVMVGPADAETGLVMLVPVPEDPRESREVSASWSGGQATFRMNGLNRQAHFNDR